MEWCKLWAEWGTDPKVQIMSEVMRCRHAMLLCLRCTQDTTLLQDVEVAHYMRISMTQIRATKDLFIKKGFIDSKWNVINWNKRQDYVSPAAKRMRRLREQERNKLRNECEQSNERVPRARSEQNREDKNPPFIPPEGGDEKGFSPPSWLPDQDWSDYECMRASIKRPMTSKQRQLAMLALDKLRGLGHSPSAVLQQATLGGHANFRPIPSNRPKGSYSENGTPKPKPITMGDLSPEERAAREERAIKLHNRKDI